MTAGVCWKLLMSLNFQTDCLVRDNVACITAKRTVRLMSQVRCGRSSVANASVE